MLSVSDFIDEEESEASKNKLYWKLVSHLPNEVEIKLTFEKPELVTSTNYGKD